jgi:hypothetical protein
VWNGTEWVQAFGQNGTVSAGPGGTFIAALARSSSSSSAGSGIRLNLTTAGGLTIVSERGGTIDPGGFGVITEVSSTLYTPTPCSPDPPLLSVRAVYVSGDTLSGPNGELMDTWYTLGSVQRTWSLFATVEPANNNGGIQQNDTVEGTFDLELALTSNTSNVLASVRYTFGGSAESTGIEL